MSDRLTDTVNDIAVQQKESHIRQPLQIFHALVSDTAMQQVTRTSRTFVAGSRGP